MSIRFNTTISAQTALLDSFQITILCYKGLFQHSKNLTRLKEFKGLCERATLIWETAFTISKKLDNKKFQLAQVFCSNHGLSLKEKKSTNPSENLQNMSVPETDFKHVDEMI